MKWKYLGLSHELCKLCKNSGYGKYQLTAFAMYRSEGSKDKIRI
jgi:hypothetical protein